MRGEHSLTIGTSTHLQGSSPHARGALDRLRQSQRLSGIIPACAGSTRRRCNRRRSRRDHPRMRGEHFRTQWPLKNLSGSSPHARGALGTAGYSNRLSGIIPACAGSTLLPESESLQRGDHPRMRGEHSLLLDEDMGFVGSSPHARGAPNKNHPHDPSCGIIPACAGST